MFVLFMPYTTIYYPTAYRLKRLPTYQQYEGQDFGYNPRRQKSPLTFHGCVDVFWLMILRKCDTETGHVCDEERKIATCVNIYRRSYCSPVQQYYPFINARTSA